MTVRPDSTVLMEGSWRVPLLIVAYCVISSTLLVINKVRLLLAVPPIVRNCTHAIVFCSPLHAKAVHACQSQTGCGIAMSIGRRQGPRCTVCGLVHLCPQHQVRQSSRTHVQSCLLRILHTVLFCVWQSIHSLCTHVACGTALAAHWPSAWRLPQEICQSPCSASGSCLS